MPLNLEEILALPDIGQKINYLKKGRKLNFPTVVNFGTIGIRNAMKLWLTKEVSGQKGS